MPVDRPIYPTADEYRQQIVVELGGGALLTQYVRRLWDNNDHLNRAPRIQYMATKVAAIDLLLGNLDEAESFPIVGDLTARLASRRSILLALRDRLTNDLERVGYGAKVFGPAMDLLETTAPVPSPAGAPDANDIIYRGDPNRSLPWVVPP